MKTSAKVFTVSYTKKIGGTGSVIVKAMGAEQALKTAKDSVFTGSDFRNAIEIASELYIKPTRQGFQGSGRANA